MATLAASLGTTIEWYDFLIYAQLSVLLATIFFPTTDPAAGILLSVGALGSGYLFRPLGGLVFGALGDRIGRKQTFVITMLLMGLATVCIGLLPPYSQIGILAPCLLVILRLIQGLALGGEYGGAATYIAECAPPARIGFWTSWIQATASLGLVLATGVILVTKAAMSPEDFSTWGWRVPFLLSAFLIFVSTWIRLRMHETPVFRKMQRDGKLAKSPVRAALADRTNRNAMLLALFGLSIGSAAINGVAFLYTPIFMQAVLKIDPNTAIAATMIGVLLATPTSVFFGALSDRYGAARVTFWGLIINGIAMLPIFLVIASIATVPSIGSLAAVIFLQLSLFSIVYGPYAAFMTQMFPPQVRYTSISLPFNIANSAVAGLLPIVSLGLISATGNRFTGLIYPIALIGVTVLVNYIWLRRYARVAPTSELARPVH